MEEYIPKESPFYHKEYTYLTIPKPEKIKSNLKSLEITFMCMSS